MAEPMTRNFVRTDEKPNDRTYLYCDLNIEKFSLMAVKNKELVGHLKDKDMNDWYK